jgi:signal transduction histidine kinase
VDGACPRARLFLGFAGYSACLYLFDWLRPGSLARLYRVAMVLDMGFIFLLVRATGGMESSFYLAFYLLIALHAFYFGLATGVLVAVLGSLLYAAAESWPPPIHLSDLGIRVAFLFLVGLSMGGLAERERQDRRRVEDLNRELRAQQEYLRRTQEQVVRSDRLATVGELAAALAHDLRNPLAGISGALHVLADQLSADDPRRALFVEVQAQIGRMNKTLTGLLEHTRSPAPQYLPVNVNDVVERSLWLLPVASGTDITVVKRLDPALPTLQLDPTLLHQALLNIVVNALQAMPGGGQLTVGTACHRNPSGQGEVVEVAFSDTGPGIPSDHVSRIFQPFFTTKAEGTGLGLAIASRIVEQHGGRLMVESEWGKGATFRILLPIAAAQATGSQDIVGAASRR